HDAPRGDGLAVVRPRLIQFSNRRQRDELPGQTPREFRKSIDVPREETAWRRAEVVLLTHRTSGYGPLLSIVGGLPPCAGGLVARSLSAMHLRTCGIVLGWLTWGSGRDWAGVPLGAGGSRRLSPRR